MAYRNAGWAMVVLLFASALVQLNDPDPVQWFAIYAAAGVVAALSLRRPGAVPWPVPVVIAAVAVVWAVAIMPGALGKIGVADLTRTMEAETPAIEIGRETIGLLIVAGWMLVVAFAGRRAHRNAP